MIREELDILGLRLDEFEIPVDGYIDPLGHEL